MYPTKIINIDEVPINEIALRSVATSQSNGSGQGFFKGLFTYFLTKKRLF